MILRKNVLLVLSLAILATAFFSASGESVYAEITTQIVNRFNLVCKDILHRPKDVLHLNRVFKWTKKSISLKNRPMGMVTLDELAKKQPGSRGEHRCAHVLMSQYMQPLEFAEYTHKTSLDKQFWLVFFTKSTGMTEFFSNANLPYSAEIIAVELLDSQNRANFIDVSRASVSSPVRLRPMGSWSSLNGIDIPETNLYLRRSDLEGTKLRAGIIENWPVSFQIKGVGVDWNGLFPSVWRQIESSLNVTTEYVMSTSTGSLRSNGSWSGLIGMAMRGEIDVIVSELTMSAQRTEILSFTRPLIASKTKIYFKQQGLTLDWLAVFDPFPSNVWKALFLWILVWASCLAFCYYLLVQFGAERRPYPFLGFLQFLFWSLQALSNQGLDILPRSSTCRIIVLMLYLVSAVLIPSYSASLISSLTTRTPSRPFDNLNDMVADGTYKLLVAANTAEYDYFEHSKDPVFISAFKKLIKTVPENLRMNNIRGALDTVCRQKNYAMFGIDAITTLRIQHAANLSCNYISILRPLSYVHLSMGLPKNHHLSQIINYYLNEMAELGVISRITDSTWPRTNPPARQPWVQVSPEEVFQIFTLLVAGLMLSIGILALEFLWDRAARQRKPLQYIE